MRYIKEKELFINGELSVQFTRWYASHRNDLYRALLDGDYEIEQEELYKVEVLGRLLAHDGKCFGLECISQIISKGYKWTFTEKEIRDFDERYWTGGFAQKVD